MSRRPATFTEADVKRAIKATQAAGMSVGSVKIEPDGTIHIVVAEPPKVSIDFTKEWRL